MNRYRVPNRASVPGTELVRAAQAFAAERHRGQTRKGDGRPFITHPTAVAGILQRHRQPPEVVAAGFLHDVLEDTPTRPEELDRRFGRKVGLLVREVTEPEKSHPWEYRKNAYLAHVRRASRGALAISCADKLHNTLSLIAAYHKEGPVVFDRFSRGVEEKLAYHRRICREIRRAWPACPGLAKLERAVDRMEEIVGTYHRSLPRESEAKFSVAGPAVLRALGKIRELGGLARVKGARERQRNVYWDTPDYRLRRGKAILKTRTIGSRGEMTFKREIGYRGGVSERLEVSAPVRPRELARVLAGETAAEPVRLARKMVGRLASLAEAVTLFTDRRRHLFGRGKKRIELDVDRVTVFRHGKEKGRHLEVELENRGVPPAQFQRALAELRRRCGKGLKPLRVPKYETGLRMALKSKSGKRAGRVRRRAG